jgi:hypothetical protein
MKMKKETEEKTEREAMNQETRKEKKYKTRRKQPTPTHKNEIMGREHVRVVFFGYILFVVVLGCCFCCFLYVLFFSFSIKYWIDSSNE